MGLLKNLNWIGKSCRVASWLMFSFLLVSTFMYLVAYIAWDAPFAFSSIKSTIANLISLSTLGLYGWLSFYEQNENRLKLLFGLAGFLFLSLLMF